MKKSSLLFFALILTACLPSSEGSTSTQPQVTVTSEMTVTLTPAATETAISPTFTLTPSTETLTLGGVTMTVDENGVVDMDSMKATGASDEIKAQNLAKVDPKAWGCDDCQIMKVDGKMFIAPKGQPDIHIADWGSDINGWKWEYKLYEEILFGNFAKTMEMKNGVLVDLDTAMADSAEINKFAAGEVENLTNTLRQPVFLLKDGLKEKAIVGYTIRLNVNMKDGSVKKLRSINESDVVNGYVCLTSKDGSIIKVWLNNMTIFGRTFN